MLIFECSTCGTQLPTWFSECKKCVRAFRVHLAIGIVLGSLITLLVAIGIWTWGFIAYQLVTDLLQGHP